MIIPGESLLQQQNGSDVSLLGAVSVSEKE